MKERRANPDPIKLDDLPQESMVVTFLTFVVLIALGISGFIVCAEIVVKLGINP